MIKKFLALALLVTGFLVVGDAYGEDEIYYCADTGSGGFAYDEKRGSYERGFNQEDRFKMKLDRASGTMELAINGLPPDAPIELTRPKYNCRYLHGFPEQLFCQVGFSHFDFNIENGKFVRSDSTSIKFHRFGIYISYGTCDKF